MAAMWCSRGKTWGGGRVELEKEPKKEISKFVSRSETRKSWPGNQGCGGGGHPLYTALYSRLALDLHGHRLWSHMSLSTWEPLIGNAGDCIWPFCLPIRCSTADYSSFPWLLYLLPYKIIHMGHLTQFKGHSFISRFLFIYLFYAAFHSQQPPQFGLPNRKPHHVLHCMEWHHIDISYWAILWCNWGQARVGEWRQVRVK